MIILESSKGDARKCYWEEGGSFALEETSRFGRERVPSLEGVVCCPNVPFPGTKTLSSVLEKEVNPVLEVNLWRRPKVGKM